MVYEATSVIEALRVAAAPADAAMVQLAAQIHITAIARLPFFQRIFMVAVANELKRTRLEEVSEKIPEVGGGGGVVDGVRELRLEEG